MNTEEDHELFFGKNIPEKYVMTDTERAESKALFEKHVAYRIAELGVPKEEEKAFAVPIRLAMKRYL